ncbi:Zn-ribbon domain-containing OB-fold protein [Nocardia jiangxiensis]|uniref:Zn-ribbon domain-containing OB-fold protein n=1 Tax=Nocardia jiangxiensis TaxID=282685 RepID=A0ABW6SE10_9NOCA|nr:OB-fold domain-containing protein [Nocardia jiangxiensis]
MGEYGKPIPCPDEDTAPFWEAARRHELAFQRCNHCGTYAHPPVAFCRHCHNVSHPSFEFAQISPRGKILNWTVMYDAMVQGFADEVPWVHALVSFDVQPTLNLTATLVDGDTHRLRLGAPVDIIFRDVAEGVTLPFFKLS